MSRVCDAAEVLVNAMVTILLKYVNVSNKHTVYLTLVQSYMSVISIKNKSNKIEKSCIGQE